MAPANNSVVYSSSRALDSSLPSGPPVPVDGGCSAPFFAVVARLIYLPLKVKIYSLVCVNTVLVCLVLARNAVLLGIETMA